MTTEDAIKILDNCRIKADCARGETLPVEAEKERDDYIVACTMAIDAIGRQIPKKVVYEYDGYYDGVPVYDMAYCPNCDCAFEEDYNWNSKHCPFCGQRLDWSEGK